MQTSIVFLSGEHSTDVHVQKPTFCAAVNLCNHAAVGGIDRQRPRGRATPLSLFVFPRQRRRRTAPRPQSGRLPVDALNAGRSFLADGGARQTDARPIHSAGPDGTFHLVWTVSWGERGIGHASSKDLIHWSRQQYIPVMEHEPRRRTAGLRNCSMTLPADNS